jgi:2-desacetyl-2-hydroxyethyl bacteriochlorophyllide A dehydrogenase
MPPTEAQSIVFPELRRAEWEQRPLPSEDQLQSTQVLVRAVCSLVNAGTELAIYTGTHIGFTTPGATYPRLPYHPGWAFAGTVETVGSAVEVLRTGDRVAGSARITDWAVVDSARGQLTLLPPDVSFEQGCLALQSVVGMQGVRLARVRLGERVAVFGQGLIGQFARQLAALDGAAVAVAIDPLDSRLQVARRHGATHAINPTQEDVSAAIAAATSGQGVDVAIEATGNPAVINDALHAAAILGRVILLGSPRGRVEIDPYTDIHRKGVSVIGAHSTLAARVPNAYYRWTEPEHHRLAVELIRQGRLCTDGLITHHVPAAEAPGIFDALAERPQDFLGVLVEWP